MKTLVQSIDLGASRAERAYRPDGVKVMLRNILIETAVYGALAAAMIAMMATLF